MRLRFLLCLLSASTLCAGIGLSKFQDQDVKQSLKNYKPPQPVKKDEPVAKQFSLVKAGDALDSASLDWQAKSQCFTCHTNVPYLYARPLINAQDPAPQDIRKALETHVENSFKGKRKLGDFYASSAATALAINDAVTSKKLHPLTKQALDHMWTVQGKDGRIPWGGGVHPVGSPHFGAAITLVAVAMAPDDYEKSPEAQKGMELLRGWVSKNPAKLVYDKAMMLWASSHVEGILTAEAKAEIIADLRARQLEDGGWSLLALQSAPIQKDQTGQRADGYATGLVVYALRQAGVPANDAAVAKGISWLKTNQLESGRWFTQSLRNPSGVLTNTASVFAVVALHSCGEKAN